MQQKCAEYHPADITPSLLVPLFDKTSPQSQGMEQMGGVIADNHFNAVRRPLSNSSSAPVQHVEHVQGI